MRTFAECRWWACDRIATVEHERSLGDEPLPRTLRCLADPDRGADPDRDGPWSTICCDGWSTLAGAYPLDGYEKTGIGRLEAQRLVQIGEKPGKKRPSGELLPLARVDLRLLDHRDMELPASDPALTARLKKLLGPRRTATG